MIQKDFKRAQQIYEDAVIELVVKELNKLDNENSQAQHIEVRIDEDNFH